MGKGIIARTMADLLAQAKDPTEAARIQRAIDSGRNKILYHGTHTDFPAVDPSKVDLGLHLGTSEQATNRLTDLAKAKRGTNRYNDGAQIMPAAVRLGNTLDMRDVGGWGDVGQLGLVLREHPELQARQSEIDELLDSADYLRSQFVAANRHMDDPSAAWVLSDDNKQILSDMRDLLTSDGYDSIKYHNEVENTDGVRGGLLEEYQQEAADIDARMREIKQAAIQRRPPPPDMNDPNLEASMQEFLARSPVLENYMTPEEKDLIQKYGSRHHDLRMNEQYRNDPYSYIVLKPENLRSINAQFDPEFDLSPDLMKAEGGLVEDLPKFGKGQLFRSPKLSELIKDIRNDAGNFRAQRVERAADEIPMLDTRYSIPALDRAFRGDTSEMMTTMNPADFEKYALQLRRVDDDYIRKLGDIASSSGFNDVPYLTMIQPPPEDLPMIFGHEGRHRSRALAGLGDKLSLVRIRTSGNLKEPFPRHSAEEFFDAFKQKKGSLLHVVPEEYGGDIRKPYQLPELYADGGLVDLARKYNKGGLVQKYAKGDVVRQWLKGYPEKSLAPLKLRNPGAGTGDPAETIAQLQKRIAEEDPDALAIPDAFTKSIAELAPRAALNNWIDTSLAKYIKRDYGSPNDPLAALAPEQRHVPLMNENLRAAQTNAVWPPKVQGQPPSKLPHVSAYTPGYFQGPDIRHARQGSWVDQIITDNPWMASLAPDDELYENVSTEMLGLPHLRDELYNALRPDTDLPDMLRLKPESLPRVSVAQASQLVGKINAWRAANKAKADLAASMNPATFIHKEYPEQNMRWVQLRTPEELPPGWSQVKSGDYKSPEGELTSRHPSYGDLEKALKYEGDTMGHCVGGYCDSVFDGTSKIYSLRDARGEPHVTIEAEPQQFSDTFGSLQADQQALIRARAPNWASDEELAKVMMDMYPETAQIPSNIIQIKGKSNNKPIDKYLPFVQDFVKSQKWGDIGDFGNTGLRRAADAFQPYSITKARAEGIDLPDYLTEQEIADITAKLQATNKPNGMKEGGMAKRPDVRDSYDWDKEFAKAQSRDKTGVSMIDELLDPMYAARAAYRASWTPQKVAWGDEDGNRHNYTAPGIFNNTVSMGEFLPGENPMAEAAGAAYDFDMRKHLGQAGLDPDNLSRGERWGTIGGEVIGQILAGGAAGALKNKSLLKQVIRAPFEYLGPFLAPTLSNIIGGIGGGIALNEALPPAVGGMMSLAEKYGLGSDTPIDADESDRLLASLGFEGAGSRITDAAFARARDASLASDRYATLEAAKEAAHKASERAAARERIASNVYGSLPGYAKGDLFDIVKNALEANKKAAQADGIGAAEREFLNRDIRAGAQVSERVPTAVQFSGDPHDPALTIGVDVIRENPEQMRKQADVMRKYLNYPRYGSKDPESVFSFMGDHAVENLLALHDMMPPDTRRMSSRWYEGANKIADDAATKYGIPIEGAAGVYASLSPQMDWYKNVSLGNRVMDIAHTQRDTRFTPEMLRKAKQLIAMPQGGFNEATAKIVDLIRDKSYGELNSPAKKAVWLRLYDEAHNPRSFDIVDPMGNVIGPRLTQKGELAAAGWGSLKDIQKAISIFENPEIDNVASMLGNMHKVRSFYNNIVNPWAGKSVTSDTHNVAAALFRPLSGNSLEVKHNLGGASSSDITGAQGTYGLYADAVRRAAAERGIEYPRAMQSITWEGIRGLYDPVAKRNKSLQEQVTGAMKDYRHKRISGDQMREQLLDIGGGMNLPDWNGR